MDFHMERIFLDFHHSFSRRILPQQYVYTIRLYNTFIYPVFGGCEDNLQKNPKNPETPQKTK